MAKYISQKDINNAEHPSRQTAIHILEHITEKIGQEDILTGELWYELEDKLTSMIEENRKIDRDKIKRRNKQIKDLKKELKEKIELYRRNV